MSSTIISTNQTTGLDLSSATSITVTTTGTLTGAIPDTGFPPSTFHSAIFANGSAPIYLLNDGKILAPSNPGFSDGLDLHDGGTIVNSQNAVIAGAEEGYGVFVVAPASAPISISNAGTIESANRAIAIEQSGTLNLTNSLTGLINGTNTGVFAQNSAISLVNEGQITSSSGSGVNASGAGSSYLYNTTLAAITGQTDGFDLSEASAANGRLVNAGLIKGTTGYGIQIGNVGVTAITNDVSGTITGGLDGISVLPNYAGSSFTLSNAGTVGGATGIYIGQKYTPIASDITNLGTIIGTGGTAIDDFNGVLHLAVGVGAKFEGNVTASATITQYNPATYAYTYTPDTQNVLELLSGSSAGTLSGIGTSFQNFDSIVIDKNAAWSLSGDVAGLTSGQEIEGFTKLDTLELTGFAATGESFANNQLTLTSSGSGTKILDIVLSGVSSSDFTVTTDGTNSFIKTDVACFYAGTRIATPAGERPVEDLVPGDEILTVNGPSRLLWVGQNEVSTRFSAPLRVLPIRIKAGALGGGLPRRDLLVSPDHALFLAGVLVQAGALVGLPGITREHNVPECFVYYHLELAAHELLYAEGAQAESFVDNVAPRMFQNWESRVLPEAFIAEMPYLRVKSARQLPLCLRAALQGGRQDQSAA